MIIDLNMFPKETIEKAMAIRNANVEDADLMLSLIENAFGGNIAYANLCLAIAAIYYNDGIDDTIAALTATLLQRNKEEKGGN